MKRVEFIAMMADVLEAEPAEILNEANLLDFPAYSSVCALMLMARLEEDAKITCSAGDLGKLDTIGDVESLIARQVGFEA
jgi:acyl carrier protein